jgi:hypothetical protein
LRIKWGCYRELCQQFDHFWGEIFHSKVTRFF